jgi:hypothetical protein
MTGAHSAKRAGLQPAPPAVACPSCGGLCQWWPDSWIRCPHCGWGDQDRRRAGLWWRLRVWAGR